MVHSKAEPGSYMHFFLVTTRCLPCLRAVSSCQNRVSKCAKARNLQEFVQVIIIKQNRRMVLRKSGLFSNVYVRCYLKLITKTPAHLLEIYNLEQMSRW